MGHNRLGALPKTHEWMEVVSLLDGLSVDPVTLAGRITEAARWRFERLANDQALSYCFWLLVRIASAARRPEFQDSLSRVGLQIWPGMDAPSFVELVAELVEERLDEMPSSGHFGGISQMALRTALMETVGEHGRSMFASSIEDLQQAIAAHATEARFGDLGHRFFSAFLARSLQAFLDRELSQHIGEARAFETLGNAHEFQRLLDIHARQSARIVQRFAGEWFSLHHWEQDGTIGLEEAQNFVAHALQKLCDELMLQAVA